MITRKACLRGYQVFCVATKLNKISRKNGGMSSRALRKLQGDKDLEISHGDDEDEDELNFASVKLKKKQKAVVNPFDLVSANPLSWPVTHTYMYAE